MSILQHPLSRLLWCLIGAAFAIGSTLWLLDFTGTPLFLATLGGSTVFLFGLTRAPAVQPRSLFFGHLSGAAIGIACYQLLGDALWVYALAQTLGLAVMLIARVTHPPAGANPIIMVHAHASWLTLLTPVLLGVTCLALIAMIWSRLYPGMARYPVDTMAPSPPSTLWGAWD